MRLPDWLYLRVERAYLNEKRIRDREVRERALRAYYARMRDAHDMGTCGGREEGCAYVPCVPLVGHLR